MCFSTLIAIWGIILLKNAQILASSLAFLNYFSQSQNEIPSSQRGKLCLHFLCVYNTSQAGPLIHFLLSDE